jgi:hypothetical protein
VGGAHNAFRHHSHKAADEALLHEDNQPEWGFIQAKRYHLGEEPLFS